MPTNFDYNNLVICDVNHYFSETGSQFKLNNINSIHIKIIRILLRLNTIPSIPIIYKKILIVSCLRNIKYIYIDIKKIKFSTYKLKPLRVLHFKPINVIVCYDIGKFV